MFRINKIFCCWGSSVTPTVLRATGDWQLGKSIRRGCGSGKLYTGSPGAIICDYTNIPPAA